MDAALGRMSAPRKVSADDVPQELLFHPRFAVEQSRPDGILTKIRPVDDFSWSAPVMERGSKRARECESVNGYTYPAEKMHHDTLDGLIEAMRTTHIDLLGETPALYKVCPCWSHSLPAFVRTRFLVLFAR